MGLRKTGIILLLLLIFQYTFGLFLVYSWNTVLIRQSIKAAIATGSFKHGNIKVITLPLQQLTQQEKKYWQQDEVTYQGKMYDVVSRQVKQNHLILNCICDEDENDLAAGYAQAQQKSHSHDSNKSITGLKSIFSPVIITDTAFCFRQATVRSAISLLYHPSISLAFHFTGVPTPPPRQA